MSPQVSVSTQFVVEGTVRHYLAGFSVDRRSRGLTKGTIQYYETELSLFCQFLDQQGVMMIQEVSSDLVRKYLLFLGETRKPGGVHAAYRAIRAFFNWYEMEFEPEDWKNPMRKVKGPKVAKNALEGANPAVVQQLMAACNGENGKRDRLILRMLYDTGLRANELLALNVEDIDLVTGAVTVLKGKGGKRRTVFLGTKCRKELRAYLKERVARGALFTSIDGERLRYQGLMKMLRRRADDAGVRAPNPHDFRRAFAITMLREGCDLARLAELMGHSSLEVLRRYLHLVTDDLMQIHAQIGPGDRL